VKLSPILSEFLSNNKQLDLTGIGRFTVDNSGTINFDQDASVREDISLVNFIAERSGKMKSLVAADLDSYLELARQFLNIGKPYLFDGIGTLTKNKFGKFEFVQANVITDKKEPGNEGRDTTSTTENSFTDYEEMFSPKKPKMPTARKLASWLVVMAGLGLAVFGGYLVYNKTKSKKNVPEPITQKAESVSKPEVKSETTLVKDSTEAIKDSIPPTIITLAPANSNTYKFIIEKAAKARALYRYEFLKKNFIDVQMETKDSILFKLYFALRSLPADTTRKKDSLQRLYGTRGRTTIELN